jgi:competence protein ComEC
MFGFVVGVGCAEWFTVSAAFFACGFFVSMWCVLLGIYLDERMYVMCGVGCIALMCGVIRFQYADTKKADIYFNQLVHQKITFEGVVISEPQQTEKSTKYVVVTDDEKMSEEIFAKNPTKISPEITTKILVRDSLFSFVQYGDRVRVEGELEQPAPFESENGRMFHYDMFLKKDDVFYIVEKPEVTIVSHDNASLIKQTLFKIKNAYIQNLNNSIPYPESTLAAGITVAGKGALPKDVIEDFTRAGAMQVVVLSGFNVTIIAAVCMKLFSFLPKSLSRILGVIAIILFTIMAGAAATIVRGAIMAIVVILVKEHGGTYDVLRSLILAAVGMLIYNPYLLQYDPSFQFSFLATLGLIVGTPISTKYVSWIPEVGGLREAMASTIACECFVLPLLIYSSGAVSLVSLIANAALAMIIPSTMMLVACAGLLGFVSTLLGTLFGWVAYVFLWIELFFVHILSSLPFALIHVHQSYIVIVLCGVVICFVFHHYVTPLKNPQ